MSLSIRYNKETPRVGTSTDNVRYYIEILAFDKFKN